MISFILRFALASSVASFTFHFLPVLSSGLAAFTTGSAESSSILRSLAFPALYSSRIDFNGSLSFACLEYRATPVRPGGTPSHFLVYLLIFPSMVSTVLVLMS